MKFNRALPIGVVLVLIAISLSAWAYPHLPPIVPTHWDASGHINGYSSRFWAVAMQPLVMTCLLLLMLVLPAISPKGFRLDESRGAFNLILLAVIVFNLVIDVPILRGELGLGGPRLNLLVPLIGVLFIIIGNYLGKFRKNFFVGIRTPWTLASDEVWLRTHRLGGHLFILGGFTLIVCGLVTQNIAPIIIVAALLVLIPTIYSFVIYRRIEGFGPNGS